MAVILKLKCPDCAETFKWPGDQKWPEFCPHCRSDLRPEETTEIAMPFISSAKAKSVDKVYRDMEKGSEFRAQVAAEQLGVPIADVSHLKITNMRDNTREGEVAHIPVQNEVTKAMDALPPSAVGFQSQGVEHSGAVQTGPFPNAGAKTQTAIRKFHATQGAGWNAMSDNPAKEVMQPGYRRRA